MPTTRCCARCAASARALPCVKLLDRVRERIPGVVLRTSFIVGFPGETDAAFERLVDFVRNAAIRSRRRVHLLARGEYCRLRYAGPGARARQARAAREPDGDAVGNFAREKSRPGRTRSRGAGRRPDARDARRGCAGERRAQAPEIDGSVFLAGDAEPGEFVRARIDKALSYDLHATVAGAAA